VKFVVTTRGKNRLRVFDSRVLRKISETQRNEVTGEWKSLLNKKLYTVYCISDNFRVTKSRRMRWTRHVVRAGKRRSEYRILVV